MKKLHNRADEFLLYVPVFLMGGLLFGFCLTTFGNIWLRILGVSIVLFFFILALWILVILGKNIKEHDEENHD